MLAVTTGLCFADPVEGFWISVDETNKATAGLEIYQRGGKLY